MLASGAFALGILLAGVLALLVASPAEAGIRKDLKRLRGASCQPRYEVVAKKDHDAEEIAKARAGLFNVKGIEVRLVPPVDWDQDPIGSLAFRSRLHSLKWLDVLFYAYRETGDRDALRQARRLAVDWVKRNKLGTPGLSFRVWFDKVVGDRAPYLAYATRAAKCERMLPRRQAIRLLRSLNRHGKWLRDPDRYSNTNRGLFMDHSLVLLGRQMRFMGRDARKWRRQGRRRFVRNMRDHTLSDGRFYLEHSSQYHQLVRTLLDRFLPVSGKKHRRKLRRFSRQMEDTARWLVTPDGKTVAFGDSNRDSVSERLEAAAASTRGMNVLPRTGLAFVRPGPDSYLSFLSDYHSGTHKQQDELSFDLYEQGTPIVSDTGYYHSDPDRWWKYSRDNTAHTTLTVGGKSFPIDGRLAYGSGIKAAGTGSGWYAIEAKNPVLRSLHGVHHKRTLLYKPGEAAIVLDRVRSPRQHRYNRFLQIGRGIDAEPDGDRIDLDKGRRFSGGIYSESSAGPESVTMWRGEEGDPMRGLVFPRFRTAVPRWTIRYRSEGSSIDYATTIALRGSRQLRAHLTGPLRRTMTLRLSSDGAPDRVLTISRQGEGLTVTEAPG